MCHWIYNYIIINDSHIGLDKTTGPQKTIARYDIANTPSSTLSLSRQVAYVCHPESPPLGVPKVSFHHWPTSPFDPWIWPSNWDEMVVNSKVGNKKRLNSYRFEFISWPLISRWNDSINPVTYLFMFGHFFRGRHKWETPIYSGWWHMISWWNQTLMRWWPKQKQLSRASTAGFVGISGVISAGGPKWWSGVYNSVAKPFTTKSWHILVELVASWYFGK